MVSEDSAIDMSFALIAGDRNRAAEAERERTLKRVGAAIAVALVHVVILAALLTAGHFGIIRLKAPPKEMTLLLPALQQKAREALPPAPLPQPETRPLVQLPPTITLPPPKPDTATRPSPDVMQAIGKELACGAGSYEHLSQSDREECKRHPWKFKKNAKGVIVLDVIKPLPEEPVSGADSELHIQQTQDPCLAAGNTHSECIHKTIFGR